MAAGREIRKGSGEETTDLQRNTFENIDLRSTAIVITVQQSSATGSVLCKHRVFKQKPRAEARGSFSEGACILLRLVPREDRPAAAAKQEVQANLEHALGFPDVEINPIGASGEAGYRSAHYAVRASAEVVVVILDEAGEPVSEGVFTADANRPTVPSVTEAGGQTCGYEGEGEIVSLPRGPTFDVAKEPVPTIADSASD